MSLTKTEYLNLVQRSTSKKINPNIMKEYESLLKNLHSDEAIEIMWETFTLQCNAAMKGNESVENSIEVHNISTRYLAALTTCRMLHTRFDSVTRILYDLKKCDAIDNQSISNIQKNLFAPLPVQERKDTVIKLLKRIQEPISRAGGDDSEILKKVIQKHCEIIYAALLIGDYDRICYNYINATMLVADNDERSVKNSKYIVFGGRKDIIDLPIRVLLSKMLFEILNSFHEYLAEITYKEEKHHGKC